MKSLIVTLILVLLLAPLSAAAQGDDPPILPLNLEPITANNIHRLERLAVFGFGSVRNLNWSPDGHTLAIEGTNGLWAYSMADLSRPHLLPDAQIETWMLEEHQRLNNDELAGYRELTDADSFSVALSSDNTLLAEVDGDVIRVWSVQNKQVLAVIPAHGDDYANGLTFSHDSEYLAAGFF
jgi:WD40 repeat protein